MNGRDDPASQEIRGDAMKAEFDPDSPHALLNALRDHPEWGEAARDAAFDRLLRRFPGERLIEAVRERLRDLGGADGEAVLRIVEAFGTLDDFLALAQAVAAQPDLSPERTWEALTLLEGTGLIESEPALAERWEELVELVEGDDPLGALAEQIEEPDGVWVALQGLGAVEPEVRAEIVAGLAGEPTRPGLVEFLRHLAFGADPATRKASLEALEAADDESPELVEAWATIAGRHPDPAVAERARRWLNRRVGGAIRDGLPSPLPEPTILKSLVTAIDGEGRAEIALITEDRGSLAASVFACEIERGIREAVGQVAAEIEAAEAFVVQFAGAGGRETIEVEVGLALGLLAGCWMLSGSDAPPALPYWIERTAGPDFRPRPFVACMENLDPEALPAADIERCARTVLDACPDWIDGSPLTFDLAEEAMLRGDAGEPDLGAVRFLFERRLGDRLEPYRRMLLWMATLWRADRSDDLARAALALAGQLGDPQHAVPGHPFLAELGRRSLLAARRSLQQGLDPRRTGDRRDEKPGPRRRPRRD